MILKEANGYKTVGMIVLSHHDCREAVPGRLQAALAFTKSCLFRSSFLVDLLGLLAPPQSRGMVVLFAHDRVTSEPQTRL
jgi:hypothetical protein